MKDDNIKVIHSPLACKITKNGHTVEVHIYRTSESPWILEVVNAGGTSICWDDPFTTDQQALDEVHRTIAEEGIESLAVDDPISSLD